MRKRFTKPLLVAAFATLLVGSVSCNKKLATDEKTPEREGYKLLWADEFNGTTLDDTIWNREVRDKGWTNNELQRYTTDEKNGFIRDGKFVIKATENQYCDYDSCKLNTHGKKNFKYGRIEVKAKAPSGKGLWPAIWMMPPTEEVYGVWPKCGEIDIMEVLGHETTKAYGTLHWGEPHAESQGTYYIQDGEKDFAEDFHTYEVEWEPGKFTWYIDGVKYHEEQRWFTQVQEKDAADNVISSEKQPYPAPFNQEFGIQINLAVGGDWPGLPEANAEYMEHAEFEIDYVRVYQKESYDENVEMPPLKFREPDETGNYIINGDFKDESESLGNEEGWQFKVASGGKGRAEIKNGQIDIYTETTGTVDYSVQLVSHDIPIYKGKTYRVTYTIWSDEARRIPEICVDAPNSNWERYWKVKYINLAQEPTEYVYEFTLPERYDTDNCTRFEFNMGRGQSKATIHIKDVRLEIID